jgi:hypothetical protein
MKIRYIHEACSSGVILILEVDGEDGRKGVVQEVIDWKTWDLLSPKRSAIRYKYRHMRRLLQLDLELV